MELQTNCGKLTPYGFACGYIEVTPLDNDGRVTLWREGGVYHIRRSDWHGDPDKWRTSRTLTDARKIAKGLTRAA